jgi:hypothetical protein
VRDTCLIYSGRNYMDWPVAAPIGQPLEDVGRIRDDIDSRLKALCQEINITLACGVTKVILKARERVDLEAAAWPPMRGRFDVPFAIQPMCIPMEPDAPGNSHNLTRIGL